jgi:hypothetical protein
MPFALKIAVGTSRSVGKQRGKQGRMANSDMTFVSRFVPEEGKRLIQAAQRAKRMSEGCFEFVRDSQGPAKWASHQIDAGLQ